MTEKEAAVAPTPSGDQEYSVAETERQSNLKYPEFNMEDIAHRVENDPAYLQAAHQSSRTSVDRFHLSETASEQDPTPTRVHRPN